MSLTPDHASHAYVHLIGGVILDALIYLIIAPFFICSIRKTLRPIPRDQRTAPMWLLWLLLLPVIANLCIAFGVSAIPIIAWGGFLVVCWVMIPYAIPSTLSRFYKSQEALVQRARSLRLIGFFEILLLTFTVLLSLAYAYQITPFTTVAQIAANPMLAFIALFKGVCALIYIILGIIYWAKIVSYRKIVKLVNQ